MQKYWKYSLIERCIPIFHTCSVLSGYGRDCLDNELDMELDDEEEMDGFTEDRLDYCLIL